MFRTLDAVCTYSICRDSILQPDGRTCTLIRAVLRRLLSNQTWFHFTKPWQRATAASAARQFKDGRCDMTVGWARPKLSSLGPISSGWRCLSRFGMCAAHRKWSELAYACVPGAKLDAYILKYIYFLYIEICLKRCGHCAPGCWSSLVRVTGGARRECHEWHEFWQAKRRLDGLVICCCVTRCPPRHRESTRGAEKVGTRMRAAKMMNKLGVKWKCEQNWFIPGARTVNKMTLFGSYATRRHGSRLVRANQPKRVVDLGFFFVFRRPICLVSGDSS